MGEIQCKIGICKKKSKSYYWMEKNMCEINNLVDGSKSRLDTVLQD